MQPLEGQLSFDRLLATADRDNKNHQLEIAYGHLPTTIEAAIPLLQDIIERHNDRMLAGDGERVALLREEARNLAFKLNNYEPGILADEDAPGCLLERLTAAKQGTVPLWGQSGSFEVAVAGMRVAIEMDGVFGIGATSMSWLGFAARALDWDRPFFSETGYRSFLGVGGALQSGYTPDAFVAKIIVAHVRNELKGKFVAIKQEYRPEGVAEPLTKPLGSEG